MEDGTRNRPRTFALGAFLIMTAVVLASTIFVLWPVPEKGTNGLPSGQWSNAVPMLGSLKLDSEPRLLLLVMLVAALGSYLHAATSFVSFVGNRSLQPSWSWWYVMRPFIGLALGLVFYFLIRGGLLSAGTDASNVNLFGLVAVAGLAGMFSKQAVDKLREVFDNLFRTAAGAGDDQREDKLAAQVSVLEKMIPITKIVSLPIPEGKSEKDILIVDVYKKYGGVVTRLPVLDHEGAVRHVIHQSLLSWYVTTRTMKEASTFDHRSVALSDFLDFEDVRSQVTDAIAFVSITATVGDAKRMMEEKKKCQDVFVTESGGRDEPVRGWLTNVDIGRMARA